MELQYWLLTRLMTPAGSAWFIRAFAIGVLGLTLGFLVPQGVRDYRASHGIPGVIRIRDCTFGYANTPRGGQLTKWACHGPFIGDQGIRIERLTADFVQDDQPIGEYDVMVASPTATHAAVPDHWYVMDAVISLAALGFAGWAFHLARPRVIAERLERQARSRAPRATRGGPPRKTAVRHTR